MYLDIFFRGDKDTDDSIALANQTLGDILNRRPVDWFIQMSDTRRKKMLIADMDSTMITIECIDELADFAGLKDQVSKVTESAMRGEIDFAEALESRVALLKDMSTDMLQECYDTRVGYTKGSHRLVQTMKRDDAMTVLVSGGFTFFTSRVSDHLGFKLSKSNTLEESDGKLTGKVTLPICDASTKLNTLNEVMAQISLNRDDIIAVGDGANDIPMLDGAGIGVAYKAKPIAQEAADFCINHTDLASILYIQGYAVDDIIKH